MMTAEEKKRQRICRKSERAMAMIERIMPIIAKVRYDVRVWSDDLARLSTAARCLNNAKTTFEEIVRNNTD